MKTFKPITLLLALTCMFCMSCQKNSAFYSNDTLDTQGTRSDEFALKVIPEEDLLSLSTITFCSPKIVPLCAGQNIDMGTVTVKTGSDDNVYVTYTTKGNWYLRELHLYVGDDSSIPSTSDGNPIPGHFPYTKIFALPFSVQQYTFIIPNASSSMTIAAHAAVVKISIGNGAIIDQQTAWGDGCSGTPINGSTSGNWGTKFTYLKGNCSAPEICSRPVHYFFDSTLSGVDIPWVDVNGSTLVLDILGQPILGTDNGNVTVAGYNYTEAEGREIYKTLPDGISDARDGFAVVATLKLSSTNYPQDVELLAAVTTIETWLVNRGKLTPYNLNATSWSARNAVNLIKSWIAHNTCADRR